MARLGHGSPAASMRYQHAAASRDRETADRLDGLIGSTSRRLLAEVREIGAPEGRAMKSDPDSNPCYQLERRIGHDDRRRDLGDRDLRL